MPASFPRPLACAAALALLFHCDIALAIGKDTREVPPAPRCWHADAALERAVGYCQVVLDGQWLHVSGVAAEGDMAAAVQSAYAQLQAILDRHGIKSDRVVRETVYTTDIDALKKALAPRRAFYRDWLPAASWVQVQRLYLPAFVVEVELWVRAP